MHCTQLCAQLWYCERAAPTLSLCSFTLGWFALRANSKSWWGDQQEQKQEHPYRVFILLQFYLLARISLPFIAHATNAPFFPLRNDNNKPPTDFSYLAFSVCLLRIVNFRALSRAHVKSALMHQSNVSQVIRIWWAARLLVYIKFTTRRRRWFARPHRKRMHRLSLINNLAGGV